MPEHKEVKWNKRTGKGYEVTVGPSGTIYYTLDGKDHREDGPAIIWPNGYKAWYLNGKRLSKESFISLEMIKQFDASELFTIQELAKLRLKDA